MKPTLLAASALTFVVAAACGGSQPAPAAPTDTTGAAREGRGVPVPQGGGDQRLPEEGVHRRIGHTGLQRAESRLRVSCAEATGRRRVRSSAHAV